LLTNGADAFVPSVAKSATSASKKAVTTNQDKELNFNITLYPNPTSDLLHIKVENAIEPLTLSLFNSNGQVVNTVSLKNNERETSLSLAHLSKGVYTIKINDGHKIVSQK